MGPFATSRRFVELMSDWFSPLQPVAPQAPIGTPPRERDYPVGYNVQYQPRAEEEITFSQLRDLARLLDVVALCVETRKDQVASIPWSIKPIQFADESRYDFRARAQDVPGIEELTQRFRRPDGRRLWHPWIRKLVHEHLVIDAVCVLPVKTDGGTGLDVIDGATIKVLVDSEGRTPLPPSKAYQQILKGIPAVDFTTDELYYYMRNPRADRIYGFSPVEQIVYTINFAIRRAMYKLSYYTEGNLPEAIIQMPENWPIDKIRQFSEWWNSVLSGQVDQRRKGFFIPSIGGSSAVSYPKQDALKDDMDEWIARVVCYAFSLPVQPFVREMNRATAQTAQETAKTEGLQPLLDWLKEVFDDLIQRALKRPDLEWAWQEDEEPDLLKRAQIQALRIEKGISRPNEVREENGDDPVEGGDQLGIVTGTGFVPFEGQLPGVPTNGDGDGNGNGKGAQPKPPSPEDVVNKRRVAPGDAFRAERARRALAAVTRLTARFLADRGRETARRLADAYGRTALPAMTGALPALPARKFNGLEEDPEDDMNIHIKVPAPQVTVVVPEQPAPIINVAAPEPTPVRVHVDAPDVFVTPEVTAKVKLPRTRSKVSKDKDGNITVDRQPID